MQRLGEKMTDHLDLRRIDPTYHLYFQDNCQLRLTSDLYDMKGQLEAIEPGSFERMLHYLAEGRHHYEISLSNVITKDFRKLGRFHQSEDGPYLSTASKLLPNTRLCQRFKYPAANGFYIPGYVHGAQPLRSTSDLFHDAVHGTIRRVVLSRGGHVLCCKILAVPLPKILVFNSCITPQWKRSLSREIKLKVLFYQVRRNYSPILLWRMRTSDTFTSNFCRMTVMPTALIGRNMAVRHWYSTWGLDKQYPQLGPHNLFFSGDYRQGFEDIFKGQRMPRRAKLLYPCACPMDTQPPAGETIYAAVPVEPYKHAKPAGLAGHANAGTGIYANRLKPGWPGRF